MRQAIEEHFILDVLKNYMTYKMYYKIIKNIPDDPELDTVAGVRAIQKYESLHPHNISQKTTIMLEHFRNVTMHKIGGKAKAMVVTPSRLHAVRYVKEFKRQIEEKGYTDLDVLVAFSGEIEDDGVTYTEEKINKNKDGETIKEKSLPEAFHTDDFDLEGDNGPCCVAVIIVIGTFNFVNREADDGVFTIRIIKHVQWHESGFSRIYRCI